MPKHILRVFLSYASADRPHALRLYKMLSQEPWIAPWLDVEKLLPGQDWKFEIMNALQSSDVVILLLSKEAISKGGYVQKELRIVQDHVSQKPEDPVFIIPIRLDDVPVPEFLRSRQVLEFVPALHERGYKRLLESLKSKASHLIDDGDIASNNSVRISKISIDGDISGNIVVGDNNTLAGDSTTDAPPPCKKN